MRVYRTGRRGSTWSRWYEDYSDVRKIFRSRLVGKGPFRWKTKLMNAWSKEVTLDTVMRNADRLVPGMGDENAYWAEVSSEAVFVIDTGTEHLTFPKPPSGVSTSIARAHNLTFAKTEQLDRDDPDNLRVVTMGYTVCKLISGTNTPSQHCPGPPSPDGGNAMDWVVKRADGSVDVDATDKVVAHLRVNGYPEVLWRGVPNHFPNHAHTSGNPKRTGFPVCL